MPTKPSKPVKSDPATTHEADSIGSRTNAALSSAAKKIGSLAGRLASAVGFDRTGAQPASGTTPTANSPGKPAQASGKHPSASPKKATRRKKAGSPSRKKKRR